MTRDNIIPFSSAPARAPARASSPLPAPRQPDDPSPRVVSLHRGGVRRLPQRDLHAIFGEPDPADDDRPDLHALLGAERRDRLPTRRSFAFFSSLLLWLTIGGCVWLIVSGRL